MRGASTRCSIVKRTGGSSLGRRSAMWRNVRLTRGPTRRAVFGTRCHQRARASPPMIAARRRRHTGCPSRPCSAPRGRASMESRRSPARSRSTRPTSSARRAARGLPRVPQASRRRSRDNSPPWGDARDGSQEARRRRKRSRGTRQEQPKTRSRRPELSSPAPVGRCVRRGSASRFNWRRAR